MSHHAPFFNKIRFIGCFFTAHSSFFLFLLFFFSLFYYIIYRANEPSYNQSIATLQTIRYATRGDDLDTKQSHIALQCRPLLPPTPPRPPSPPPPPTPHSSPSSLPESSTSLSPGPALFLSLPPKFPYRRHHHHHPSPSRSRSRIVSKHPFSFCSSASSCPSSVSCRRVSSPSLPSVIVALTHLLHLRFGRETLNIRRPSYADFCMPLHEQHRCKQQQQQ